MCGITALISKKENIFPELYESLYHLQHRGQDSFGFSYFDKEKNIKIFKKQGLVLKSKKTTMWDAFYVSILSEKYKGSFFPYLRGVFVGKLSNFLSYFTGESSSITYVFTKANKK